MCTMDYYHYNLVCGCERVNADSTAQWSLSSLCIYLHTVYLPFINVELCERLCVHAPICTSLLRGRTLHHPILNSWHLQLQNNLHIEAKWGSGRLFSLSSAATVKFAHSHAFFVSLTFHVEANSQPGAIFLPASFIQWGHTIQNPGNVKNGKV